MMASLPWFRMYSDFIFDEKIEFLAFEDQRHFVFVLCMKNLGLIDKEYPQPGMLDRVVAKRLGLYGEAFENAKSRLVDAGLIDGAWQPIAWGRRQFRSDTDPTAADRKRRQREREKQGLGDVTRDTPVTSRICHADVTRTDTESDTDTEEETDKERCAADAATPSKPARTERRAQQLPADFTPNESCIELAGSLGVSMNAELAKFRDHNAAKGNTAKDWHAAFRNWLRKAYEYKNNGAAPSAQKGRRVAGLSGVI